MTDAAGSSDEEAWRRFAKATAGFAHASRVAPLFDGALGDEQALKVARHPRLTRRLSALLEAKQALAEAAPPASAADRALALMSGDRLASLARQAGAVSRADAVAREVRADRVAALKEAIGENAYAAALAHRADAVVAEEPETVEALASAIEEDGKACLALWLSGQSKGVAERVRLRFPDDESAPEPREGLREAGPKILRMLAS